MADKRSEGIGDDDPAEVMADIASLCRKVAGDHDAGRVLASDLVELRDTINRVRKHVSMHGYKTVPGLVKDDAPPPISTGDT